MVQTIVLFAHVGFAMLIIGLVLLQRGKGADAGTGFGAGASGTVFGARGSATFFSRATAVLATLFFVTSLALAYFATQRTAPAGLIESTGTPTPGALQVPTVPASTTPETTPPAASDLPALPSEETPESGDNK
jgi:preprotein translocase subunit SecG